MTLTDKKIRSISCTCLDLKRVTNTAAYFTLLCQNYEKIASRIFYSNFVKLDFEISLSVDQQTRVRDRTFEGVPDPGCQRDSHAHIWSKLKVEIQFYAILKISSKNIENLLNSLFYCFVLNEINCVDIAN